MRTARCGTPIVAASPNSLSRYYKENHPIYFLYIHLRYSELEILENEDGLEKILNLKKFRNVVISHEVLHSSPAI